MPDGSRQHPQAGFTVLEAVIGAALLGMALMSQTSVLVANAKLAEQSEARSEMFVATREFMERLRAYEDWGGLYAHLRLRQTQAEPLTVEQATLEVDAATLTVEGSVEGYVVGAEADADAQLVTQGLHPTYRTHDGRHVFEPGAYLPGFETITDFGVLIEVPTNPDTSAGAPLLREDVAVAHFKLPADLNGDGVIDGGARDDDYRFLPIRVLFVWKDHVGATTTQVKLTTWIRGER